MYEEDLRQGGIFPDIDIWRFFVLQSLFDLDDLPDIRDRVRQVVPIRELQGQKINPRGGTKVPSNSLSPTWVETVSLILDPAGGTPSMRYPTLEGTSSQRMKMTLLHV